MRKDLYQDMYDKEQTYWWHVRKRKLVLSLVRGLSYNKKDIKILDIGCGTGKMMEDASQFGTVYGIDSSDESLRFCKKRGLTNVKKANIEDNLPFGKNAFDVILLLDVLEHTNQHEKVLKNIYAILKKDGILIMTVPAYEWLYSYWDRMLGHIRRYTIVGAKTVVRSAGFTVAKSSYFNSFILPLVIVFRLIKSMTRTKEKASDFISLPDSINAMFIYLSNIETILLHHMGIPFGLSVLIVAKK